MENGKLLDLCFPIKLVLQSQSWRMKSRLAPYSQPEPEIASGQRVPARRERRSSTAA
jgi:hypothetical protein